MPQNEVPVSPIIIANRQVYRTFPRKKRKGKQRTLPKSVCRFNYSSYKYSGNSLIRKLYTDLFVLQGSEGNESLVT